MMIFSDLSDIQVETCIIYALVTSNFTPQSVFDSLRGDPLLYGVTSPSKSKRFIFLPNNVMFIPSISLADFLVIKSQSTILDTRSLDYFKEGHVTGSFFIWVNTDEIEEFSAGLKLKLNTNTYITVICEEENSIVTLEFT
jgi:hypothetical protein